MKRGRLALLLFLVCAAGCDAPSAGAPADAVSILGVDTREGDWRLENADRRSSTATTTPSSIASRPASATGTRS
jgi:hypothetical protein